MRTASCRALDRVHNRCAKGAPIWCSFALHTLNLPLYPQSNDVLVHDYHKQAVIFEMSLREAEDRLRAVDAFGGDNIGARSRTLTMYVADEAVMGTMLIVRTVHRRSRFTTDLGLGKASKLGSVLFVRFLDSVRDSWMVCDRAGVG